MSGLPYRRRWEDNIKTDLRKIDWVDVGWIDLYEHVAGSCECGNEPSVSIKFGEFID
jgi:hypothetical protein